MEAFFNLINACGIGVTLFLIIPLVRVKNKTIQDKLLLTIFIIIFNFLALNYANNNELKLLFVSLFLFTDPIELLLGTLLFLYVKSLISEPKNFIKRNKKHFIVPLVYFVTFTLPVFISIFQDELIFNYLKIIDKYENLFLIFLIICLNIYIIIALKTFVKYESLLKNQLSTLHKHKSIWIKRMLVGILIVSSLDFTFSLLTILFKLEITITDYLTPAASVVLMYYLGFNAIHKTQLLTPYTIKEDPISKSSKPQKQTHSFTSKEIEYYQKNIHQLLNEQKLYLDEDLNLQSLSNQIGVTDKKLSYFINQILKTTFYDLINNYRINAVKEKLINPNHNHLTIIAIANDCGFRSKTTFLRIFKKETDMLPSEYKKRYQ